MTYSLCCKCGKDLYLDDGKFTDEGFVCIIDCGDD